MELLRKLRYRKDRIDRYLDEKRYWDDISKHILPATIEEMSTNLIINNDLLVTTIALGVPPISSNATEGFPHGMTSTLNSQFQKLKIPNCSLSISVTLIPTPVHKAVDMVEHAVFINMSAQEVALKNNPKAHIPKKLRVDSDDLEASLKSLHHHEQNLFYCAFIISIFAPTEQDMRGAVGQVQQVIEANRILYERPDYRHLDTFISSLPIPHTSDHTWTNPMTSLAAKLINTRSNNNRLDDVGLLFGRDMNTGIDVIVDLSTLIANHFLIVGPTGSGKSYFMAMMTMRAHDMLNKRIIYTTPKDDTGTSFESVVEFYGSDATMIKIGPGGKNINPLQIMIDHSVVSNEYEFRAAYDFHKDLVGQFFKVFFEGTFSPNMESYLDMTLNVLYKSKGIKRDDPVGWEDAEWPTMAELRDIWSKDADGKGSHMKQLK